MAVLENQRHEVFAQAISRGCSGKQAYGEAYGLNKNEHSAEQSASRLLRNVKVQARIRELQSQIAAKTVKLAVCSRDTRVKWLDERLDRLRRVIEARAKDMADVPGGETGLLVKTFKQIGRGEDATLMPEYAVDTGMLREMRAHEEQAARELGQWTDRKDVTLKSIQDATDEELAALLNK